jgi:hypothetical protein
MELVPDAYNQMTCRAGFLKHGSHANEHQNSSNGCPDGARPHKSQVGQTFGQRDNQLRVVP